MTFQTIDPENKINMPHIISNDKGTHFVWVYIKSYLHELEYSVSSVIKHFVGPKKLFVVGDKPNIRGVIHIPVDRINYESSGKNKYYRALDAHNKLDIIANCNDINENFIYMYDDIFLLRRIGLETFKNYSIGLIDLDILKLQRHGNGYRELMQMTLDILKKNNLPIFNYENHLPHLFNKTNIRQLISRYDLLNKTILFNTLYGNTFYSKPDHIINEDVIVKIWEPRGIHAIRRLVKNKLFLNFTNDGLSDELATYIKQNLSGIKERSPYH